MRPQLFAATLLLTACSNDEHPDQSALRSSLRHAEIFVEGADLDQDGGMSLEEFKSSLEGQASIEVREAFKNRDGLIASAFDQYDLDGDGKVTVSEMQQAVQRAYDEIGAGR